MRVTPWIAAGLLGCGAAAMAQAPTSAPIMPVITTWQNQGGDVPVDPAWRMGILPNGLRYAVRRVTQPTRGLSIRVRVDAGALVERDAEQGWAHLLEHMVFRGTKSFPDGEGVRVWQRLGATFGSDSNAFTTLTATTFNLDLPRRDVAAYDQAMAVLAEMVSAATIDPKLLATERDVVLAERALRRPPVTQALEAVSRPLFQAGTRAEHRDIVGTPATLEAATAPALTDYYRRWYRPDRTIVVATGDLDPIALETEIVKRFGSWTGTGPAPADPDYGRPKRPAHPVAAVVHPQAREGLTVDYVQPHDDGPMTIARVRESYLSVVLTAIVNQRLATLAQAGGPVLNAGTGVNRQRHVADTLVLGLQPRPGLWAESLDQVYGVLNAIVDAGPSQAEIDQTIANLATAFDRRVQTQAGNVPSFYANEFVNDVDRGDVSATPEFYRDLFVAMRPTITPAAVRAEARRLVSGPPRLLYTAATPIAGGDTALVAALGHAEHVAGAAHGDVRLASLDELKIDGVPATIVTTDKLPDLRVERVRLSNGVELVMRRTSLEKDTIHLALTVGHGLLAHSVGDAGLYWTAGAVGASGVGPFSSDELRRLLAGRRISIALQGQRTHVLIAATTGAKDLPDALKLVTGELIQPRVEESALARLKSSLASTYPTLLGTPATALVPAIPLLYGGDHRFEALPTPERARSVTLDQVRGFWRDELARGPLRLVVVGDFDRDALTQAVVTTIGRLPPRTDQPVSPALLDVRAMRPDAKASLIYHRGDPDQASVVRVIPVPALLEDLSVTRTLDVTASILSTRLLDEFREKQGGSYTPSVSLTRVAALPHFGEMVATAQLRPGRLGDFDAALDRVIADLARTGPSADELARAKATATSNAERAEQTNAFWENVLAEDLDDPRSLAFVRTIIVGPSFVTADAVRDATRAYLLHAPGEFTLKVLPDVAKAALQPLSGKASPAAMN